MKSDQSPANESFYAEILRQEYQKRKDKNAQYSIRAFARDTEFHAGELSQILRTKKRLSLSAGIRILKKLNLDKEVQEKFLSSIVAEYVEKLN